MSEHAHGHRGLRIFSKLLFCSVLGLIFMGALVKSHEAGLAVPDWPTSYGENMFLFPPSKWQGGIFYEHVHRLIASGVGALTVVFMLWCLFVESRPWVRWLSVVALVAVIIQGLLGGLTVLYRLPDAISVSHGILAQTFLLITLVLAYAYSHEYSEKKQSDSSRPVFIGAMFFLALLYVQLLLGALTRHAEAGLAVLEFPSTGGAFLPAVSEGFIAATNELRRALTLPPVNRYQISLHLLHRLGGAVLLLGSVIIPLLAFKSGKGKLRLTSLLVLAAIVLQFLLGAMVVLTHRLPFLTSYHVMVGAVVLALTALLALRASRLGC